VTLIIDWALMELMKLRLIPSSRASFGSNSSSKKLLIFLMSKQRTNALDLITLKKKSHFTLPILTKRGIKSKEKTSTSLVTPTKRM